MSSINATDYGFLARTSALDSFIGSINELTNLPPSSSPISSELQVSMIIDGIPQLTLSSSPYDGSSGLISIFGAS
jgi:hypothetical protein